MAYRIEIKRRGEKKSIESDLTRGAVRDRVDSLLFNSRGQLDSVFLRFRDGTEVIVVEEK